MPWQPLPGDEDTDPKPLGLPLDRVMKHLGSAKLGVQQSVFDAWPELVGPQVASQAKPVSLRDGVLTVAVADPAWATQLRYLEAELVSRIAASFGPDEVTKVEVRVRPAGGRP